jgi:hypothetical protein
MDVAQALANLRKVNSGKQLVRFVEDEFVQVILFNINQLGKLAQEICETANNQIGSSILAKQTGKVEELGIKFLDLKRLINIKMEINQAIEEQGSPELKKRIDGLKPQKFASALEELDNVANIVFKKEYSIELQKKLLKEIKDGIEKRRSLEQGAQIISPLEAAPAEGLLNSFLEIFRKAKENEFVDPKAIKSGYNFLFHLMVTCFKENLKMLLRSEDSPQPKLLFAVLTQAHRLYKICEEFQAHVGIRPPQQYRKALENVKALAKAKLDDFKAPEKEKLLLLLNSWPELISSIVFTEEVRMNEFDMKE